MTQETLEAIAQLVEIRVRLDHILANLDAADRRQKVEQAGEGEEVKR